MFSKLMQDTSDSSYIVEVTEPPFQTSRGARIPHVACIPCRSKKLKCSGDKTGCQRCLLRDLACVFPDQPVSRPNRKREKHTESVRTRPSDRPESSSASSLSSPREPRTPVALDQVAAEDTTDFTTLDFAGPIPSSPDADLSGSSGGMDDEMVAMELDAALANYPSLDNGSLHFSLDSEHEQLMATLLAGDFPFPSSLGLDESLPISSLDHPLPSAPASCRCSSLSLCVYERTQILYNQLDPLVHPMMGLGHAQDTLSCSKDIIQHCDLLMDCRTCRTQSHFAMILLSIARQLIICLERQCSAVTVNVNVKPDFLAEWQLPQPANSNNNFPSSPELSTVLAMSSRKSHNHSRGRSILDVGSGLHKRRPSSVLPASPESLGFDDREDEIQVLKTLLTLRMRATAKLLGKLQTIIEVGGWQEHRELLGRVSSLHRAAVGSIGRLGGG